MKSIVNSYRIIWDSNLLKTYLANRGGTLMLRKPRMNHRDQDRLLTTGNVNIL